MLLNTILYCHVVTCISSVVSFKVVRKKALEYRGIGTNVVAETDILMSLKRYPVSVG